MPMRTSFQIRALKTLRLLRASEGAVAVEFAMVALPFFVMLFGIIELALIFMVSMSLDNAMSIASRTIRTGQLQSGGAATAAAFKASICANLGWLQGSCSSDLSIDVRTFSSFNNVTLADPVSNGTFNQGALQFSPGVQNDIVLVRAYYQWTLITPVINQALQRINGGKALITATTTFRNEPYVTGT